MWVDWIHRAYVGGLRVMVALAVNNVTLAKMTAGPGSLLGLAGPPDWPIDDQQSADLQIKEMKLFVKRHDNFMQIAYSAEDLHRIVAANKLAIVLGVEIDNIGNLGDVETGTGSATLDDYKTAIRHLYTEGVRYISPSI